MRVSGKITHSFYCFLRARGFDVSRLFELTPLEMEFLKDPAQWMGLNQVESFLNKLVHEYSQHFVDQDFLVNVGHSCFELGAWGELDSVLKMRKAHPEPIFSNIPVFLSYFISDGFSLVNERSEPGFFSFKCNLSSEEYPFVTEYLRAVLESLPLYSNNPRAEVKWIRDYIQIKWSAESSQTSLFSTSTEINIKPELLKDFRQFLEKVEKELYHQRKEIGKRDKQIRNLKDHLLMQGITLPEEIPVLIQQMEKSLFEIKAVLLSEEREKKGKNYLTETGNLSAHLNRALRTVAQLKETLNIKA